MKAKINFLYITLGVFIVFSVFIIGTYVWNFHSNPISKDADKWGVFGDYIGGILNPIISALNVFAFIYLTKTISDIEERRANTEREHNRQLAIAAIQHDEKRAITEREHTRQLAITTIKHDAYKDFVSQLNTFSEKLFSENNKDELMNLNFYIFNYVENMAHLFSFLSDKDVIEPLNSSIKKIVDFYSEEEVTGSVSSLLNEFLQQKNILIKKFQQELIN